MVALLNILWVPFVAFADIAVPDRILTLPILAAFAVSIAHFVALYRLRVRASLGQMLGAVCAAMSLQWTVAQAVGVGLVKERLPFLRTAKGGTTRKGRDFPASGRPLSADCCWSGASTLVITNVKQVREIYLFALVLVVQSLPFLSAVGIAVIEGTRFNSFAYWRGIGPRPRFCSTTAEAIAEAAKIAGRKPHRSRPVAIATIARLTPPAPSPRAAPSRTCRPGWSRR